MAPPDKEIISLYSKDKHKGIKAAFDKYYHALCLYADSFTSNMPVAEDIVQDVFVKCWNEGAILTITSSLRAYLYTCVRNACINHLKKNKIKTHIHIDDIAIPDDPSDYGHFPEDEDLDALRKAIEKLPAKGYKVFQLVVLHEKSYKDAASELNLSVNTVKTHLCRAMQKIRKELRS